MQRKARAAAFVAAALFSASYAAAQDRPSISLTSDESRQWDLSGDAGWLSGNKSELAPGWDDWYDVATGGGAVGYYWTPRVKTEFRVSFSGEGRTFEEQRLSIPGQPFPLFRLREHYFQTTTAGAGMHYQFFENQWFHPFVGGGVDIVRESHRILSPEQRLGARDPRAPFFIPPLADERTVSYAARPFVTTGFKWYVNERGFVRSEVKAFIGSGRVSHTTWTAGIGVDL